MADYIILEKRSELTTVTPMMKQYLEVKDEYSDHIRCNICSVLLC